MRTNKRDADRRSIQIGDLVTMSQVYPRKPPKSDALMRFLALTDLDWNVDAFVVSNVNPMHLFRLSSHCEESIAECWVRDATPKAKALVASMRKAIRTGASMPPMVIRSSEDGVRLLDGYHRTTALALEGVRSHPVIDLAAVLVVRRR